MILRARSVGVAAVVALALVAACGAKDARIGSLGPTVGTRGGSSGMDSIAAGAGKESSNGGTGPAGSGGTAGASRAGASGVGASGRGTATGGGGTGAGAGAGAGGGAGLVASGGNGALSGATGDAGGAPDDAGPGANSLIAIGANHACVVVSGQVYCWGSDNYGETGAPGSDIGMPLVTLSGLTDAIGLAASPSHTCAVTHNGRVYCWGDDSLGQLGVEVDAGGPCLSVYCSSDPLQVPGITTAVEVVATTNRTCARLADGTVQCWGDVGGLSAWADSVTDATSITLSPVGACVTTQAGTLSCSFVLPAEVAAIQDARRVVLNPPARDLDAGGFGCVIGTGGSVTCFGNDSRGARGIGDASATDGLKPALPGGVGSLALGNDQVCALDSNGVVKCWGANSRGQVGAFPLSSPNCESDTCERAPRPVLGLPSVVALSAGEQTCALASDGTVWCWGNSFYTYADGAPIRMVGPWELGGDACVTALGSLQARRKFESESECTSDADCVALPIDLSCDHTCAVAGIGKSRLASATATMAMMESDFCAPAAAAGCAAPTVSCPALTERAVCEHGYCTYDAPERTGCTNRCACDAERFGALLTGQPTDCSGFDIQPNSTTCDPCEGGGADIVVANTGPADFDGDVVVSFEYPTVSTPPLPAPKTVHLHLAFGERSDPIHFDSDSTADASVRVTATGDCYPQNDGTFGVTFPGPPQSCQ